jgi:hypothetical protein
MQMSVEIPLNLVVESNGRNVTVNELLASSSSIVQVGDEIPEDLLNTPAYADLKQVIDDNTYSYWCVAWTFVVSAHVRRSRLLLGIPRCGTCERMSKYLRTSDAQHVGQLASASIPRCRPCL